MKTFVPFYFVRECETWGPMMQNQLNSLTWCGSPCCIVALFAFGMSTVTTNLGFCSSFPLGRVESLRQTHTLKNKIWGNTSYYYFIVGPSLLSYIMLDLSKRILWGKIRSVYQKPLKKFLDRYLRLLTLLSNFRTCLFHINQMTVGNYCLRQNHPPK